MSNYKKFAFISYSHRDMAMAKWLQKNLERFKLPTQIHNEIDSGSRYLRPVFRDQSDLNTGILSNELRKHLEESKYLILICSKNSAQSQWVSDEVQAFIEMGRLDRIIPLIISDGLCERDLFPIFLREYFERYPELELLGVNIQTLGKQQALICIVSKMLDVSFDSLWKRHQRQQQLCYYMYSTIVLFTCALTYLFVIPVSVCFTVSTEHSDLPTSGNVSLIVNRAQYISPIEDHVFNNIKLPGYKRFGNLNVIAAAPFFDTIDTVVSLGLGLKNDISVALKRDNSFSLYQGIVLDEDLCPIPDVEVSVAGITEITDSTGSFEISIPKELQKAEQNVTLRKSGFKTICIEDESPGINLKYIMHQ